MFKSVKKDGLTKAMRLPWFPVYQQVISIQIKREALGGYSREGATNVGAGFGWGTSVGPTSGSVEGTMEAPYSPKAPLNDSPCPITPTTAFSSAVPRVILPHRSFRPRRKNDCSTV